MTSVPRILLVDDDPAIRASLRFSLELEGYEVATFAAAEELLVSPQISGSDCLIVDFRLPGMDGLELLEILRGRGVTQPAILITTTPSRRVRARAAALGAPLIEKPLLCDGLTAALRDLCGPREWAA
jgi:FixJ family two-component response regulator